MKTLLVCASLVLLALAAAPEASAITPCETSGTVDVNGRCSEDQYVCEANVATEFTGGVCILRHN